MKAVIFHEEATAELEKVILYYEQRKSGLGKALLSSVEQATSLLQEFPNIGAPYKQTGFRHFVVARFPYILFYLEMPDHIWIAAVSHGRRRPDRWSRRTPGPASPEPPEP